MIKPNVTEFADLTGIVDTDETSLVSAAADDLVERGSAELVVLSLGPAGAYAAARGRRGVQHLRSPVVPVRSRAGAGDSMLGAMVAGAAQGMDVGVFVRLGIAAGAAAVMQDGAEVAHAVHVWRLFARLEHTADRAG